MRKSFIACAFLALFLAACALSPKDLGQAYMFSLSPAKTAAKIHTGSRLNVELPTAAPELDTHRISLVRDKSVRDYYAGARWADFLPVLAQDSLVKTLDGSGLFKAVASDQTGLAADMILKLEIRDFQAEYAKTGAAPVIRVGLAASLVTRPGGRILASFQTGSSVRQAASDSLPAIHAAFKSAFLGAQARIVEKLNQSLADGPR
ncbi:MAG: hypothetical protein EPN97_02560 [Alphaproteobacteria bacterium]|nr:MAG: hypothetical protein EPN97_02560 [Alphaproteobacteria bacterium]